MIVVIFAVLLVLTVLWAIKHAGFTADPDRRGHSWMGDEE